MDTNNIDVVRAIVKAARPSDAKRAPPRKPRKPPPALQRAAALVQGVDACESALKRCARAYAMPDDDSAMTDAARDAVDARVRALLRECQAALEEPSSDNGKPGSREAHARGGVEVARARTAALAALFRDLEVLRRRREAAASAPLAIRAAVDAEIAFNQPSPDQFPYHPEAAQRLNSRFRLTFDAPDDLLEACRTPLFGFNTNEPRRALATRRLVRSSRVTPRDSSSRATFLLTAAGEMPSWRAPSRKLACSAVARKASSWGDQRIVNLWLMKG